MKSHRLLTACSRYFQIALRGGACVAGLGLAMATAAQAEVLVTKPSPFANCTADNVASQPGINYPEAEVEPWVDANPANPKNLIAGWQQDRWSDGGARGDVAGYSFNGGATWKSSVPPGITKCAGGPFERASDPWVTISPNGTAYFNSLAFQNNEQPCNTGGDNAILVNRSTDGGKTWGAAISIVTDTDGRLFNDKNSMTADPVSSNHVYAVWDKLIDFTVPSSCDGGAARVANASRNGDGVANARDRLRKLRSGGPINPATIFTGPTYFSRTTNGGASWEPEKMIFDPGNNAQTINNLIAVHPNGTVINFFTHLLNNGSVKLGMVKSSDRGAHFGPLSHAFGMVVTNTGTLTPDAREPVRDANILFDVAVDRENGNLYVVWQDGSLGNVDRVHFSMSTNGGNSWSPSIKINATPSSKNKYREQAFIPSVEVGANHKVVVTYYDFRNDIDDGREMTDFWAISCDPAAGANCRAKSGWGNEQRLTSSSFDMLDAPVARGHFLGDYQGLVNAGGAVKAVFGKAVSDDVNDMFAVTVP
jgi:hypothetical protein